MTSTITATIQHYSDCDARATRCAVENERDMLRDRAYSYEAAVIATMSPAEFCDHLLRLAAQYQADGLMGCTCAALRLRSAEEDLRIARRRDRAGLPMPAGTVEDLKALRDALKAAQ